MEDTGQLLGSEPVCSRIMSEKLNQIKLVKDEVLKLINNLKASKSLGPVEKHLKVNSNVKLLNKNM